MCKRQIDELKQELQQSIVQEEFETAAELRDQIRKLEKEMPQE
jgi:protein arginine kinase activator